MHLGFVPTDPQASAFGEIVEATRKVCDHCASNSQFFHLETGQETAQELAKFIMAVNGRTDDELKEIFLDMIREHNEENVSTRQPDPRAIVKAEEI